VNTQIIDALRPGPPALDPDWEAETVRAILEDRTGTGMSTTDRRGRLTKVALVAAAVVALIGGAVVARNALPANDLRPAKPVQDKVQTIDPSKATKLKLGDTLEVMTDLPKTFNGDQVLFWAFLEDDVVLGTATEVQDETAPGAASLMPSHPVMYDIDTRTFTLLDDRERPVPTQIVNMSGNETAIVWAELVGVSAGTSNFTFYSYDRRTQQVITLGEFNDPDGQIIYGDDLALAGGTAYFSTLAVPAKVEQPAVYAVPIDGSKPPSVIAQGGRDVRISGDTLTYGMGERDHPTYFLYDLQTGEMTPAPVSDHAGDPGFCGAEFTDTFETWCVDFDIDKIDPDQGRLTIKEASGRTTEFAPFDVGSLNGHIPHSVTALGSWTAITVTTDDGQDREFLVDLDTKEVKVFPDNTSFTALSPDHSTVLISSFSLTKKAPSTQRIVRIPD
jgi:hypothetical protein